MKRFYEPPTLLSIEELKAFLEAWIAEVKVTLSKEYIYISFEFSKGSPVIGECRRSDLRRGSSGCGGSPVSCRVSRECNNVQCNKKKNWIQHCNKEENKKYGIANQMRCDAGMALIH